VDSRVECGTFNDKLKRSKSTEAEKLDFIYKDLTTLMNVRDLTEWFVIPLKVKSCLSVNLLLAYRSCLIYRKIIVFYS